MKTGAGACRRPGADERFVQRIEPHVAARDLSPMHALMLEWHRTQVYLNAPFRSLAVSASAGIFAHRRRCGLRTD
ncbi:hypothetical protein EMIT0158MI4_280014 [Burkholderia ambifaria]